MYWKLTRDVALRSWPLVPYAYYLRGWGAARKLTQEEFEMLSCCDGETELLESDLLGSLEVRGFAASTEHSSPIEPWQKPRFCDNRYFPAMNWAITGKCNLNCRHCFMAADNARNMAEFTWEECLTLLDGCERCGVQNLTLTGGEPMLHPHFMELCGEISRRGLWLSEITTNGSLITAELLTELTRLGLHPLIKISFDGLGHHDWMRQKAGAEDEALSAIRLCVEQGFSVRAQTNVHRRNVGSMLPTAELLEAIGVEEMRLIRTTEAPRWEQNAGDACLTFSEYYEEMLSFTRAYLERPRRMEIDIWQFLQFWPSQRTYHLRPAELGCGQYRDSIPVCRGNRGMVAITAQGEAIPCNQLAGYYTKHGMSLGNVKQEGLAALLQESDYLTAVTATVGELFEKNLKCGMCPWRKICLGGCRAIAQALTGDSMGADPAKCAFFGDGYVKRCRDAFPADWNCLDNLETYLSSS